MRRGLFPGQEEALIRRMAELRREAELEPERRMLTGMGLDGFVGLATGSSATGGMAGIATPWHEASGLRTPVEAPSPELEWAREKAAGRLEDLLEVQIAYATEMLATRVLDAALWMGIMRLSNAVLDRHPRVEAELAGLLLPLRHKTGIPPMVQHLLAMVDTGTRLRVG